MLIEGVQNKEEEAESNLSVQELMIQGIATSIDALSVGFTIAEYQWSEALIEALIIGVVTFFICIGGLLIGKKFGTKLAGKASILGGVILIAIGLEIFLNGIFG
jgi:putative Mn2+ efflux pump MntP